MKIIYRYLFKKFLGPFALTFFFALFILLMQFLWKYVDELVGKGLEVSIILELLFYASAGMITLAAPLAVLLSSLMTFGSLGEQSELIAMKSAGISINKLIFSLSFFSLLIACGSFWFADNVSPKAYIKMKSLQRSILDQKPTLSIEEGIFYDGFENFTIRVGKKHRNNKDIFDVLLFDHSKYQGNTTFTYAKRGRMVMTDDQAYMLFYLYDGFYWDESSESSSSSKKPLVRSTFSEQYKRMDISSFKFEKVDANFYSKSNQALSNDQIVKMIDTVMINICNNYDEIFGVFLSSCSSMKNFITDTILQKKSNPNRIEEHELTSQQKSAMLDKILKIKNDFKNSSNYNRDCNKYHFSRIASYKVEWYKKYVLAVACILFFFIGAPLGSIIRKGGIAVPLVITVAFFSTYFMFSIFGEKIAKGGAVEVWLGMWTSTLILIPIGAFLTYQATVDSALLSSEEIHKKLQLINYKAIFTKKNESSPTYA